MGAFSFYWHDYETFGADPMRDRPAQFGGVRTDADLNEIGTPLEVYCRPSWDYLPSPDACLVTGITPQLALAKGLPEAEFIRAIHAELARPGTCGAGYNSIRFDDEVTRFTLYRNFFEPYSREWQNGNSRWDLIDVVRMTCALRPDGIEWPLRDDGSPSFRLEHLTAANDIPHQGAHSALADVRATIALARLVRMRQPRLFDYALSLRDKKVVADLVDIKAGKMLLHVSSRYPASRGCSALVLPIAWHPTNRNSVICADLGQDPEQWLELDATAMERLLFTRASELAEGEERIAVKQVHLNRSPMLVTAAMLDDATATRLGIDLAACRANWRKWRTADPAAVARLVRVLDQPYTGEGDVDTALYGGFIPDSDKPLMQQVRDCEPAQLANLQPPFSDSRLRELLFRYRARNWPQTLSAEERAEWREYCRLRITDPAAGGGIVLADYLARLRHLRDADVQERHAEVLTALEHYADQLLELIQPAGRSG